MTIGYTKEKSMDKAYLVLANGTVFEGRPFGAEISGSIGELVFTTGVVGYLETLTDPSYAGQIIMQTYPLIGNYGVIPEDFEGDTTARGYVVREWCDAPSNFRSQGTIDEFLKQRGIPGIYGIDTRQLTRILREEGVMNAAICREVPADLSAIRSYTVSGVVAACSCRERSVHPADGEMKHRVVLMDYGAKHNIIRELNWRGCEVTVLPYNASAEDILALKPDGLMLSNGPGDPEENTYCIEQIRKLVGKLPIFGICLGHQLLALAMGGRTTKLKYGHRGANQPVTDLVGVHTYITSQNHGYAVVSESVAGVGRVIFENANDHTCEGVEYPDHNCFSVQFHPEACSGPLDTQFLFDRFISMMGGNN